MKANAILEAFLFDKFYKNKVMVLVSKANNKFERHYYPISKERRILIWPEEDKETYQNNPVIEGKGVTLESDHKTPTYAWIEGEKFATPLFKEVDFSNKMITSENDMSLIDLGRKFEKLNNPFLNSHSDERKAMLVVIIAMVIVLAACAINLFFSYMIANHLGIKLL